MRIWTAPDNFSDSKIVVSGLPLALINGKITIDDESTSIELEVIESGLEEAGFILADLDDESGNE